MKKKRILLCFVILVFAISNTALAKGDGSSLDSVEILVEHGYTESAAQVIPEEKRDEIANMLLVNPEKVDISKVSMEVDILSEIEALFTYSDEELIQMGADADSIKCTKKEFLDYYSLDIVDLAEKLGLSEIEAKMLQRSIETGIINSKKGSKIQKNGIKASGTITSSEMYYYQTVINRSSASAPNYNVTLSYSWVAPYFSNIYKDVIVVGWGGQLNSSNIDSSAEYYYADGVTSSTFGAYYTEREMTARESIQAGIEFEFDQLLDHVAETESGYATFTIYQTRFQNYDSKIISNYCHRVPSITGDVNISISASGPSVSLTIGTAYDRTPEKRTTIRY